MSDLSPQQILQYATGAWATAILDAGIRHDVFGHIERGRTSSGSIAEAASISPRGAQALVDGLVGLKLLTVKDGAYANSPESAEFLVKGKQKFIGGFVSVHHEMAADWLGYAEIVRTGASQKRIEQVKENAFWETLVTGIAPLAVPVAHKASALLGWANLPSPRGLDIGGGSGIWSAIWLREHPGARMTQFDWANVNAVARGFVAHAGAGDRFDAIDGDYRADPIPESTYDVVVVSNICHMEPPDGNRALLRRCHAALRPGGKLVVSDFVIDDDRSGPEFSLIFNSNMLVETDGGATYRKCDYRSWLEATGFTDVRIEETGTASSLVIGTRA